MSSLVTVGAAIGPFLFCHLADKMGRKYTLLSSGVPFLVCYLILAFGKIVELFYVARLVMGLTVGGVFSLVPIYAGEVSDKDMRSIMGSLVSCAVCGGLLFSYSVGPYVDVMVLNLMLAVFAAVFLVLFAFLGEEVPHYYIIINEEDMAKEALQRLRNEDDDIEGEFNEIQTKYKEECRGSFRDVFSSKGLIKSFITSIGLLTFQTFSGINVVLFYGQTIFQNVGTNFSPEICTIIIGCVQFLSSFIAPAINNRLGRKLVLCCSALGMTIAEVSMGTYIYLESKQVDLKFMSFFPLICLIVFIITYNAGYGPIPWVMLGELFPTKVKSTATSFACCINWLLAFFITKYFLTMLSILTLAGYFWFSAGCCVLGMLFAKFYVIETKGKTLQEIQEELNR